MRASSTTSLRRVTATGRLGIAALRGLREGLGQLRGGELLKARVVTTVDPQAGLHLRSRLSPTGQLDERVGLLPGAPRPERRGERVAAHAQRVREEVTAHYARLALLRAAPLLLLGVLWGGWLGVELAVATAGVALDAARAFIASPDPSELGALLAVVVWGWARPAVDLLLVRALSRRLLGVAARFVKRRVMREVRALAPPRS